MTESVAFRARLCVHVLKHVGYDATMTLRGEQNETTCGIIGALPSMAAIAELAREEGAQLERTILADIAHRGVQDVIHEPNIALLDGPQRSVVRLVMQGADVNATDGEGRTALFHAVRRRDVTTAAVLLRHGADPLRSTGICATPLMMAAAADATYGPVFVRLMLDTLPADALTDNDVIRLCHLAVHSTGPLVVLDLLRGRDTRRILRGTSLLRMSTMTIGFATTQILLELGADPVEHGPLAVRTNSAILVERWAAGTHPVQRTRNELVRVLLEVCPDMPTAVAECVVGPYITL